MKAKAYWNSHRRCYSMVQGGRVMACSRDFTMTGVRFVVSECTRQRVLVSGKKEPHAYVCGEVAPADTGDQRVRYNPFRSGAFTRDDGNPIHAAASVRMTTQLVGGKRVPVILV